MTLIRSRLTRWQRLWSLPIFLLVVAGMTTFRHDDAMILALIRYEAFALGVFTAAIVALMQLGAVLLRRMSHAK